MSFTSENATFDARIMAERLYVRATEINMQRCYSKVTANPNTELMRTICIGNQVVETMKTYKLLGVPIREDLK